MKSNLVDRHGHARGLATLLLLLASGCAPRARGADVVTIHNSIGDDQRRESIEIRIDDAAPVRLEVRQLPLRRHASASLRIADGIHSFTIKGEMETTGGKTIPIRGGGAIAREDWLVRHLLRDSASIGTAKAWSAFHQELGKHTAADLSPFALTRARAVTTEELGAAEQRLGVKLPAAYRESALRFGSWTIGAGGEPLAELAHPSDVLSVWDWVIRYHGVALKSDVPAWQSRYESTRSDLVLGAAGGAIVFHGRADARCRDGSPSFEIPAIEHEDFLVPDTDASEPYFAPPPANCENFRHWHAWHSITSALGAVVGPSVVVVSDETSISRDTDASSDTEAVVFPEPVRIFDWIEPGG